MTTTHIFKRRLKLLENAAFCYPIIDNHTHNLLKEENRSAFPFEGLTSEASGEALEDATESVALYRATLQLSELYGCEPTFEAVKKAREAMSYEELCDMCMRPTGIVSLLLDDGIDRLEELCYGYKWHDRFATTPSKRIVRVEVLAQNLIKVLHAKGQTQLEAFKKEFEDLMVACCRDSEVVGFKSVACYRTGLDITKPEHKDVEEQYRTAVTTLNSTGKLRLASKPLNDFIVRMVLGVAGRFQLPVQFHTGLGDNDISLVTSNPAVMQPIIKEFPGTVFVLLHSSYPFTQEAGYLATVYKNVYLDFGEVFPMVSRDGQLAIIRQVLELTPTTKILWSTDGHWWPETYYLAVIQVREALYEVLADSVSKGEMTECQAVTVIERFLFHNSNKVYKLGLTPQPTNLTVPFSPTPASSHPTPTLTSLAASGTRFLRLHWVDFANTIRYRVIPITRLQRMLASSSRPGFTVTKACLGLVGEPLAAGFGPSGEYFMVLDLTTLKDVSYANGHAFAMGTLQEKEPVKGPNGADTLEVDLCPRTTLRRIVESAKSQDGLEFLVGFETEFVLLTPRDNKFMTPVNEHSWCCAPAIPSGSAVAKALDEIAEELERCGIELQQYHSEAAEGQYEIVTGPLPPLEAVDALVATRQIIYNIAQKHGLHATLSPKPYANQGGSASHTHISLLSSKTTSSTASTMAPISRIEASFLQSLLDHLPAACAFTLSSPASYSRMIDGVWSGGTWVCWGRENREVPVRLCGTASRGWHFEIKALDGTGNPYLAIAALLYAGILGVRKGVNLTIGDVQGLAASMTQDEREKLGVKNRLARSVGQAIDALRNDKALVSGIGEELVAKYISTIQLRCDVLDKLNEEEQQEWMARNY